MAWRDRECKGGGRRERERFRDVKEKEIFIFTIVGKWEAWGNEMGNGVEEGRKKQKHAWL